MKKFNSKEFSDLFGEEAILSMSEKSNLVGGGGDTIDSVCPKPTTPPTTLDTSCTGPLPPPPSPPAYGGINDRVHFGRKFLI